VDKAAEGANTVFRVARVADDEEVQRFMDLSGACVVWVKDPTKLRVQELATGTDTVIREVPREECCRSLRTWLPTNKHFLPGDERADMERLVREACGGG
jgi:hypothetical protein